MIRYYRIGLEGYIHLDVIRWDTYVLYLRYRIGWDMIQWDGIG